MANGAHGNRPARPEQRRPRWRVVASLFLGALGIAAGIVWYGLTRPLGQARHVAPSRSLPGHIHKASAPGRVTLLLIGTDNRAGDPGENSDVLMLCSIDNLHKRIELLSIPRDTRVTFPDGHWGKINEGLQVGGPPMAQALVEELVEQPVDHYVLARFGGLVNMIDTLGGVTLNVPKRMYYVTGDKQYGIINLQEGLQTLTGEQALAFVRYRHDALGDISRTERQQTFLAAFAEQLIQPTNVPKLPYLVQKFWTTVETDMTVLNVMELGSQASQYRDYPIVHTTLPGSFHNPDGEIPGDQSYWIVNPAQARYATKLLFTDGIGQTNPVQDPSLTQHWKPPARAPVHVHIEASKKRQPG